MPKNKSGLSKDAADALLRTGNAVVDRTERLRAIARDTEAKRAELEASLDVDPGGPFVPKVDPIIEECQAWVDQGNTAISELALQGVKVDDLQNKVTEMQNLLARGRHVQIAIKGKIKSFKECVHNATKQALKGSISQEKVRRENMGKRRLGKATQQHKDKLAFSKALDEHLLNPTDKTLEQLRKLSQTKGGRKFAEHVGRVMPIVTGIPRFGESGGSGPKKSDASRSAP